jgi:PAS domain S-box-containing protein
VSNTPSLPTDEQFRLLVENVVEYGIFMLTPSGEVASWNNGAERAIGYSANEIVGRHFSSLYNPDAIADGVPADHLAQAAEKDGLKEQGWRVRKNGTRFWANVAISPIRNGTGELVGFAHVIRDLGELGGQKVNQQLSLLREKMRTSRRTVRSSSTVTHDIREEKRVRRIEAEIAAAEKANKAKDDFLAMLSHELRTPLTPALAAASYLSDDATNLPQDLREELAIIRRNIQLEARLIDDLLDFTRLIRGKIELHFEVVDAHRLVREIIEVVGDSIIEKELDVKISLDAVEHHIWADPVRIRQVFWNLVRNAAKFTPARGHINIRSVNDEHGRFQLAVSDTGIGIEPEARKEIFNAFRQESRCITRDFGGLGLGLTISKSLIDLHHGAIAVESAGKNCGALFRVTLDTVQEDVMNGDKPVTNAATPRSLRLLLVEDHDDTRRTLARLLTRCGHKVSSTDHVESALKLLESKKFDAVVSDIGLPDRSGYELIKLAKQRHPIKGIALSGFGMEEDIKRSYAAGFDHHLTKPVDFQHLRTVLSEIVG